jgi:hypothetical protein
VLFAACAYLEPAFLQSAGVHFTLSNWFTLQTAQLSGALLAVCQPGAEVAVRSMLLSIARLRGACCFMITATASSKDPSKKKKTLGWENAQLTVHSFQVWPVVSVVTKKVSVVDEGSRDKERVMPCWEHLQSF